jgi:phospholipase C
MQEHPDQETTTGITRRRLLGAGAAATALGAASVVLPPNVRKAIASPPPNRGRDGLKDIKHVVLLMQENRSFDHYFGSLSGVLGFDDPKPMRLSGGRPVFYQPDPANPNGYLLPYRLNTKISAAQAIPSTSHAWEVQHAAWNGGKMDNWVPAHIAADGSTNGPYTMGYMTREDIPFQYALADAFTILDHYHCSVLGPTGPNRHMWMSGTIDPDGLAGGPSLTTSGPANQFSWTTYPKRLSDAGVSWRVYRQPGSLTGAAAISKFTQFGQAQPGDPMYDFGMTVQPLGQFEYDCLNDSLPTVSWILPPSGYDEHPAALPAAGAQFVAGKIDAIAANPDVWAKTSSSSATTRTTACSTTSCRPHRRRGRPASSSSRPPTPAPSAAACPSAWASACRASSCRHGPSAATSARRCPITLRSCSCWSGSPASWRRTSAIGGGAPSAT